MLTSLFDKEALNSIIITIGDIDISMTIEGHINKSVELICSSSLMITTDNNSALVGSFGSTCHSMIPLFYHIDSTHRIDKQCARVR